MATPSSRSCFLLAHSPLREGVSVFRGARQKFFRTNLRHFWSSHEVPNTGSVARDILATERTFLAWARTGLGFVGAGSALGAAYHRNDSQIAPKILPASVLLITNGVFLLVFAVRRYSTVLTALNRDMFPVNTRDTLLAVMFTSLNTGLSLGIVWWVEASELRGLDAANKKYEHLGGSRK